jgi:CelD/BcsL family acetyltransferase involved in cellulose biosynthesis
MATAPNLITTGRVDFKTIADLRDPQFAEDWDQLADQAAEANCFLERWFFMAGLAHLDPPQDLKIAAVYNDAQILIGILPLHIDTHYGRQPLKHVRNWLHPNSFLGTPLVLKGHEEAYWLGLLSALENASWAEGLLLFSDMASDGRVYKALHTVMQRRALPCIPVLQWQRAMLERGLSSENYYTQTVRPKKRKEIRRLQSRLAELGTVKTETLTSCEDASAWANDFLKLERSGWKGEAGSALGSSRDTGAFFTAVVTEGLAAGRVEILRLSVDDTPIAMLINFMTPAGSFQFKIAYDEAYARFSPGVLIELENYAVLDREGFQWMDSCAQENHPMIDSLWSGRRPMAWVAMPMNTVRSKITFKIARMIETGWARIKRLRTASNDNRTKP